MKYFYEFNTLSIPKQIFKISLSLIIITFFSSNVYAQDLTAPDLLESSDTGRKNNDNITSDTTPTFQGSLTANTPFTIYANDIEIGTGVSESTGSFLKEITTPLVDNEYEIKFTQTIGGIESTKSEALKITIDTQKPTKPDQTDLYGLSDSGFDGQDNYTNDTLPIFIGSSEKEAIIAIFDANKSIGSGYASPDLGSYEIKIEIPVLHGIHQISVTSTDIAGNVSVPSNPIQIEIDTISPTSPSQVDIPENQDSGKYDTDDITNVQELNLQGTKETGTRTMIWTAQQESVFETFDLLMNFGRNYNVTLDSLIRQNKDLVPNMPSDRIEIVEYFRDALYRQLPIVVNTEAGEETSQLTEYDKKAGEDLKEGGYNLIAISIDKAGNYSVSQDTTKLIIDITPPKNTSDLITDTYYTNPFIESFSILKEEDQINKKGFIMSVIDGTSLNSAELIEKEDKLNDQGVLVRNITERIDNYTRTSKIEIETDLEDNQQFTYSLHDSNNSVIETLSIDIESLPEDQKQNFDSLKYEANSQLNDGNFKFTLENIDLAGNVYQDTLSLTIDTTPPTLTEASIIRADDSGNDTADNKTEKTIFSIEGSAEENSFIEIWNNGKIIGTDTTNSSGNYLVNLSDSTTNFPDGSHTFKTIAYDIANNKDSTEFIAEINTLPLSPKIESSLLVDEDEKLDIKITRNTSNLPEVNYFKITDIKNGKVFLRNNEVRSGEFLMIPSGRDNLEIEYQPDPNLFSRNNDASDRFSFHVWAAKDNTENGLKMDINSNPIPEITQSVLIEIKVDSVNDAPTFTVSDIDINEDEDYDSIGWVSNISEGPSPDAEHQSYEFTILDIKDPSYFQEQPHFSDSKTGKLKFHLAEDVYGTTELRVRLKDNGGLGRGGVDSLVQTITININGTPDYPIITQSGSVIEGNNLWVLEDGTTVLKDQNNQDSLVYEPIEFSIVKNPKDGAEVTGFIIQDREQEENATGDVFYLDATGSKRLIYNNDFITIDQAQNMLFIPKTNHNDSLYQSDFRALTSKPEKDDFLQDIPRFTILSAKNENPDSNEKSEEIDNARIIIEPINDAPSFTVSDWNVEIISGFENITFDKETVVNNINLGGGTDEEKQTFTFEVTNLEEIRNTDIFITDSLPSIQLTQNQQSVNLSFGIKAHTEGQVEVKFRMVDSGQNNPLRGDNNNSEEKRIVINIRKPQYHAPSGITLNPNEIKKESLIDTEVGEITFQDPDPIDQHTIELASGLGDTHNHYFRLENTKLISNLELPDLGALESLSIRVKISDSYGLTSEEILTIDLTQKEIYKSSIPVLLTQAENTKEDASFNELKDNNQWFSFEEGTAKDDDEISHFYLSKITNGTLHLVSSEEELDHRLPITKEEARNGLIFTPEADYFGNASFKIQAAKGSNQEALSDTLEVKFDILSVNDKPNVTLNSNEITLEEDQLEIYVHSLDFEVFDTGTENESDQIINAISGLSFEANFFNTNPEINIVDKSLSFGLKENAFGRTEISFRMKDNGGVINSGVDTSELITITLDISAKADKPEVIDPDVPDPKNVKFYHFVTEEDSSHTFTREIVKRSDEDGDSPLFIKISNIQFGSIKSGEEIIENSGFIVFNEINSVEFIPSEDYFGEVSFDIQTTTEANEDSFLSEKETIKGLVLPINDKPSFGITPIEITSVRTIFEYENPVITNLNSGGLTDLENDQLTDISYSVEFKGNEIVKDKDLFFEGSQPSITSDGKLKFILKSNPPEGVISFSAKANDGQTDNNLSDAVDFSIIINAGTPPITEKPVIGETPDGKEFWETKEDTPLEGIFIKTSETDLITQVFFISSVKHGKLYARDENGETINIDQQFISKGQALSGLTFIPKKDYYTTSETDTAGFTINGASAEALEFVGEGIFVKIPVLPVNDLPEFQSMDVLELNQSRDKISIHEQIISKIYNGAENEKDQFENTTINFESLETINDSEVLLSENPKLIINPTDSSASIKFSTIEKVYGENRINYTVHEKGDDYDDFIRSSLIVKVIREQNYAPEYITITPNETLEQQPIGTLIGRLSTEDENKVDEFRYELIKGEEDNDYFQIKGDSLIVNKILFYDEATTRNIVVRSTDLRGEFIEEQLEIEIIPDTNLDLIIPNAFTPNNDGQNDTWEIGNIKGHENANVQIFNSRGIVLFSSNHYKSSWDGTFNGVIQPKDSYYYTIQLQGDTPRVYKGIVSILK